MKRGVKKKNKLSHKTKQIIIIVSIIVLVLLISLIAYLLIFKKGVTYFGFTIPDFTAGANLGDSIGDAANANVWEDAKINPFGNES